MMLHENPWVSPEAIDYFKELVFNAGGEQKVGIHVFLLFDELDKPTSKNVSLEFCDLPLTNPDVHEKRDYEGFSLYMDKRTMPFLVGAKIQYVPQDSGETLLVIQAPALFTGSLFEELACFIDQEINPFLAQHGGSARLIEITNEGIARLQFLGGCHGCGSLGRTMAAGIEPRIKERFPSVIAVEEA